MRTGAHHEDEGQQPDVRALERSHTYPIGAKGAHLERSSLTLWRLDCSSRPTRIRIAGPVVAAAGAQLGRPGARRDHAAAGMPIPGRIGAGHYRSERHSREAGGLELVAHAGRWQGPASTGGRATTARSAQGVSTPRCTKAATHSSRSGLEQDAHPHPQAVVRTGRAPPATSGSGHQAKATVVGWALPGSDSGGQRGHCPGSHPRATALGRSTPATKMRPKSACSAFSQVRGMKVVSRPVRRALSRAFR